jgi:hypothetical protein
MAANPHAFIPSLISGWQGNMFVATANSSVLSLMRKMREKSGGALEIFYLEPALAVRCPASAPARFVVYKPSG